jgi:hypothetical protein
VYRASGDRRLKTRLREKDRHVYPKSRVPRLRDGFIVAKWAAGCLNDRKRIELSLNLPTLGAMKLWAEDGHPDT